MPESARKHDPGSQDKADRVVGVTSAEEQQCGNGVSLPEVSGLVTGKGGGKNQA